ncbi:MAG: hypothetical protein ACYDBH_23910 [Acidobacteriaceae bacterium]
MSRWENDKEPIGPRSEKLLRLRVGDQLAKMTAIKFDAGVIFDMKIRAWRSVADRHKMVLVLN